MTRDAGVICSSNSQHAQKTHRSFAEYGLTFAVSCSGLAEEDIRRAWVNFVVQGMQPLRANDNSSSKAKHHFVALSLRRLSTFPW